MVRKSLAIVLGLGVLAATGVASGTPCCTLAKLAPASTTEVRDCCAHPSCCDIEKRGPAQAPSVKAAASALPTDLPLTACLASGDPEAVFGLRPAVTHSVDRPPPLDLRDTHLRISVFRI